MKKAMLAVLVALFELPAVSCAHDLHPGYGAVRGEPAFGERRWWGQYPDRRGYWHLHRVPRRHGPGYDYFYHWHPADRYSRYDDRPWHRFED